MTSKFGVSFLFFLLTLVAMSSTPASASKKIRYPFVISAEKATLEEDKVEVVSKQAQHHEVMKRLREGQSFKDTAVLKVETGGWLKLAFSPKASLLVFADTLVEIPDIAWQDGAVSKIILHHGSLRYVCDDACDREFISDLVHVAPAAGEFIFSYQPKVPKFEALVISGELLFRGLENENSVTLKAGQKNAFTGVLENDQVAYDTLLHGRKVAQGKMATVESITPADLKKFAQPFVEKKQKKSAMAARLPLQICEKPFAELNQCRWVCENNPKKAKKCALDKGAKCVRSRCNANGEWAEPYELPADQERCSLKPIVAPCDY